ncbi:outer membrane protein assembly factor BamB family protein [[Eubacterium] cellulosolvens]
MQGPTRKDDVKILCTMVGIMLFFPITNFINLDFQELQVLQELDQNYKSQIEDAVQYQMFQSRDLNQSPWVMFRYNESRCGYIQGAKAPETNNVLWTFNTTNSNTGNGVFSSAAIVGDRVFIGSGGGKLFCLNLTTGAYYWNYSTGSFHGQSCSPAVANGKVFISNDFVPQLWCINATTGKKIWNFTIGGGLMRGIYSSPVAVGGRVYFGTDKWSDNNDRIYCLPENDPDSDGNITMSEIYWKYDMPDKVWSSPTVVDNKVFVGCGDANSNGANKLYCFYTNNGTLVWTYPTSGNLIDILSTPAASNGKVYFGAKDNNVYALYAKNGTKAWSYTTGGDVISSPAVAYNRVFIGSNDNNLYCLNADTGAKIWDYTTGDQIWSSPTVADKKVYVGSRDGKVYCFNAIVNNVQKIWEYYINSTGNGICSSPSIADGKVVIGGVDPNVPKIYCFADIDTTPPTIIKTYPQALANDIPPYGTITINFSEPMDDLTLTTTNISVKDSLNNNIIGTVNYYIASNSATFTPTSLLVRNETYTVTVAGIIRDVAGVRLDGNKDGTLEGSPLDDYSWSFTISENKPPTLTNPKLTPGDGDLETYFRYSIVYTDLDNDTPILSPAYIRLHIDGELTGRAMTLDTIAALALRDGNFSNGEQYFYSTQISVYGEHTYQFKCSDGIDTNFTQIFNNPLIWDPQEIYFIPDQEVIEDIDLVLDLNNKISDDDTNKRDLILTENSSYATVDDFNITFNYPNSFNYPSGRTYEIVNLLLFDPTSEYEVIRDIRVDVIPVNDAPSISGVPDFIIHVDDPYIFNLTPYLNDEDNRISELEISTNSSYVTNDNQNIIFLYSVENKMDMDYVKIMVSDGELTSYQNITVTITGIDEPFYMASIPDQIATEDINLVLELEDYISIYYISITNLSFQINSNYGTIQGTKLIFNYPNSFNYPSGRIFESIQLNASYNGYTVSQTFKIIVQPLNDGPELTVGKAPSLALENTNFSLQVTYLDVDGSETPKVEIILGDKPYSMKYLIGDIHQTGGSYELELNLPAGEFQYYFRANDMENAANSIFTTKSYELEVVEYTKTDDDSDGDGMPDVWELQYGLDPFDPADALNDTDGDQYPNLQEYYGLDGKPGGNDSSDPNDELDLPVKGGPEDDKDGGRDTEDKSIYLWVAIAVVIVIVIVLLLLFLFVRHKKGGEEEPAAGDSASIEPTHLESQVTPRVKVPNQNNQGERVEWVFEKKES